MRSTASQRDSDIVLRPGVDGVRLVRDRAYFRAYTLRVGGTDQSYVDLDDPLRLEFDYLQRMADVVDCTAAPGRARGRRRDDAGPLHHGDPATLGSAGARAGRRIDRLRTSAPAVAEAERHHRAIG